MTAFRAALHPPELSTDWNRYATFSPLSISSPSLPKQFLPTSPSRLPSKQNKQITLSSMSTTEETPVPVVSDDAPVEKTEETSAPATESKDDSSKTEDKSAGEKRPAEDETVEGESDAKK